MGEFLELLLDRRGTRPDGRRDCARVALVVEGGGMRGVVGAGAASALHDLGLASCFDDIYGVSAGALTAAYLAADCSGVATPIFWETLLPARFLRPARALRGRPVMNLDYLIDEAVTELLSLDEEAITANPVRLHVIASSLDARVVLRTLPRTARRRRAVAVGLDGALRVRHPQLRRSEASSCGRYLRQLDLLDSWEGDGQVWALAPSGSAISTYCRSASALAEGANLGYGMVCEALGAPIQSPFSVSDSLVIPSGAPVRAIGAGAGVGGLALAASLRLLAARRAAATARAAHATVVNPTTRMHALRFPPIGRARSV